MDTETKDNILYHPIPLNPKENYQLQLGMTPLFWWDLDLEYIKKILFYEIIVISMYNPIHLMKKLRSIGLEIDYIDSERKYRVYKKIGERYMNLVNFDYFLNLIMRHFFPEETVIGIIDDLFKNNNIANLPDYAQAQIQISQNLF